MRSRLPRLVHARTLRPVRDRRQLSLRSDPLHTSIGLGRGIAILLRDRRLLRDPGPPDSFAIVHEPSIHLVGAESRVGGDLLLLGLGGIRVIDVLGATKPILQVLHSRTRKEASAVAHVVASRRHAEAQLLDRLRGRLRQSRMLGLGLLLPCLPASLRRPSAPLALWTWIPRKPL
eukprot:scaffold3920_cov262-Pinguiococcus_pyrenoidosus.AAC.1